MYSRYYRTRNALAAAAGMLVSCCSVMANDTVVAAENDSNGRRAVALLVAERDFFRNQSRELKLRLEAVGADISQGSGAGLEQKLFRAVSDLRLASKEAAQCKESLLQLVEATSFYRAVTAASTPDASVALEGALRVAASVTGLSRSGAAEVAAVTPSLVDAQVVSVNEEISCAVINVGAAHGVVRGMPFRVVRDGSSICELRVHDVRDRLSAALIEVIRDGRAVARAGDSVAFHAQ